jgi:Tfp pilus assembly protein PilF
MADDELPNSRAQEFFQTAFQRQLAGDLEAAISLYTESIEAAPSAEAYTFRGWTRAMRGELEAAIDDCHQAIAVDAEYGNPYNDIGAYLIELGRPDEAIPWLEKAIAAPRYEARCHPWNNLARIAEGRSQWPVALGFYKRALGEAPDSTVAARGLARMRAALN